MNDLQKKILDIFKEVADLCRKNDIRYYAIGGTAIGAARHQGFIPWDDDLDIAIPIEMYDRFIEAARRELPDHLRVVTPSDVQHYPSFFIKVVDVTTTFIEKKYIEFPDAWDGVFIDIMPLSGVPEKKGERKRYLRRWKRTAMLNYARRFPRSRMATRARVAAHSLLAPLSGRIPFDYFTEKMFREFRRRPLSSSAHTGYVWSVRLEKLIFDAEDFGEGVLLPFEDTYINCPAGYDRYLTIQFGNYMELPPKEKRVGVHPAVVDLDHPYTDYLGGGPLADRILRQ